MRWTCRWTRCCSTPSSTTCACSGCSASQSATTRTSTAARRWHSHSDRHVLRRAARLRGLAAARAVRLRLLERRPHQGADEALLPGLSATTASTSASARNGEIVHNLNYWAEGVFESGHELRRPQLRAQGLHRGVRLGLWHREAVRPADPAAARWRVHVRQRRRGPAVQPDERGGRQPRGHQGLELRRLRACATPASRWRRR